MIVATADEVPNGVTGDNSTPANRSGNASHNRCCVRTSARGSAVDGRTNRSSRHRCINRAGVTFAARSRLTSSNTDCNSEALNPSTRASRLPAGNLPQNRSLTSTLTTLPDRSPPTLPIYPNLDAITTARIERR
ncbi:hypothetical protein GCM10009745_74510 [Kribbella yunnanensis]|uniref:Uncharacterized protein n=1 Tax=Kribbella yunnanensis TaxID=190194 RepID=A0ABP4UZV5_9ACTN